MRFILLGQPPLFATEKVDQQFYQLLQYSVDLRAKYIAGYPVDDVMASIWSPRPIRYKDDHFPEIRLLVIHEVLLVKVCTHLGCDRCAGELTECDKAPLESFGENLGLFGTSSEDPKIKRRLLLIITPEPIPCLPVYSGVETVCVPPSDIADAFFILSEVSRHHPAKARSGFYIRDSLFPFGTAAIVLLMVVGAAWHFVSSPGRSRTIAEVVVIGAAILLLPRLLITIGVRLYSRFRLWRPRGEAGGAHVAEAPEPLVCNVRVNPCPVCGSAHVMAVSLRRWSVQFHFTPHWLDPYGPSAISSPHEVRVRLICPTDNKPFQATVTVRKSAREVVA
jgi:hypothetical protein